MIFSDLRNIDSELVRAALKLRCPICKAVAGKPCVTLTDGALIYDRWGSWVHIMRADGL